MFRPGKSSKQLGSGGTFDYGPASQPNRLGGSDRLLQRGSDSQHPTELSVEAERNGYFWSDLIQLRYANHNKF
jgi:hypothetical protein